jgi:hypothetical protein
MALPEYNEVEFMSETKSKRRQRYKFSAASNRTPNKLPTQSFTRPCVSGVAVHQANSSNFVNFLNGISDFANEPKDDLLEHMYTMEPEIASAVDSFALMVRESFKYFDVINDTELDNLPDKLEIDDQTFDFSKANNKLLREMVDVANKLSKELDIKNLYEIYASVLFMHGNLFLKINKNLSLTVLPNDRVTVLDTLNRLQDSASGNTIDDLMMQANFLVVDENLDTQKIYNKGEFIIIRFRDTPLYVEDSKGRVTYGIYGVSPLRRTIIPVWYKRIIMANDALWRYRNVPRLHVQLAAESFNSLNFQGNPELRRQKAEGAATSALSQQAAVMEEQGPDQAFITLDTTKISTVDANSGGYMQANELLNQVNESIFSAVNMPVSIIKGVSSSNYASELVIYAHASIKVAQIADKISRVILKIMKERLRLINPSYPVEFLECNISADISANPLDNLKKAQFKYAMSGCYTETEIRRTTGDKPLTEEQKNSSELIKKFEAEVKNLNTKQTTFADYNTPGGNSNGQTSYPTTSHSADKQPTDTAQAVINKGANSKINEKTGMKPI